MQDKDAELLRQLEIEQRAIAAERAYLAAYGPDISLRQYADACAAIRQDLERGNSRQCPKVTQRN